MVRGKFGDLEKGVFLDQYRQWGRMTEAAAVAGVTAGTVRDHMEKDQEFAEAVMEAEGEYKDKLLAHHQDLLFNGVEKEMYDRNGNIVSRETQYPIRLIEMELKKHDSGYREKQELEVKHKGGVLLAPAEVGSIEDWETRFNNAKNVTPDVEDKKIEDKNFEDAEVVED